jgi:hypothetical protein
MQEGRDKEIIDIISRSFFTFIMPSEQSKEVDSMLKIVQA